MIFICLGIFRDDEHLYLSKSVRILNNKLSFGPEDKKLIKFLEQKFENFHVKLVFSIK